MSLSTYLVSEGVGLCYLLRVKDNITRRNFLRTLSSSPVTPWAGGDRWQCLPVSENLSWAIAGGEPQSVCVLVANRDPQAGISSLTCY